GQILAARRFFGDWNQQILGEDHSRRFCLGSRQHAFCVVQRHFGRWNLTRRCFLAGGNWFTRLCRTSLPASRALFVVRGSAGALPHRVDIRLVCDRYEPPGEPRLGFSFTAQQELRPCRVTFPWHVIRYKGEPPGEPRLACRSRLSRSCPTA